MKYIYSIIPALFTVFMIASCSDSPTSADRFEQKRFGNFIQSSEYELQWVGPSGSAQAKATASTSAQGDSTYFEGPNGNSMRIEYFDYSGDFAVIYADSSKNTAYFDTTSAISDFDWVNPFNNALDGGGMGISENHFDMGILVSNFSCDSTYNFEQNFEFFLLNEDGSVHETIVINADGVAAGMSAISCQN